jgi:arabinofuranosyltransferase
MACVEVKHVSLSKVQREGASRFRRGRVLQAVLLSVPLVIIAVTGWAHRWITDDGFIYMRVVQQVRAGNGPVFNAGARVEAFTGPLWLIVLSVADLVTPIRLEWLVIGLGLAGTLSGIALAMAASTRLVRANAPQGIVVPFGALAFSVLLPVWYFATSGLETGLTFAWLGASLWILARWAFAHGRPLPLAHGVVLGLGWLVRPDMVVFSALFLGVVVASQWRYDRWQNRVMLVFAVIGLPLAYQVFRMGYYGSLVANTAIAKEGTRTRWDRGWEYFRDLANPYWLWVPGVVLALGGYLPLISGFAKGRQRRAQGVVAAFVIGAILQATYVVAVGGDYLHARLLMPAIFAICAPVAVVPVVRQYVAAVVLAPWVVVCGLALRPPQLTGRSLLVGRVGFVHVDGSVTLDDLGWGRTGPNRAWYTGPAYYHELNGFTASYERVDMPVRRGVRLPLLVAGAIGIPSYALGPRLNVLDIHGLAEPLASHLKPGRNISLFPPIAGHEKPLPPPWIAAMVTPDGAMPAPDLFPEATFPLIARTTGAEFQEQVAWARAALRCPDIRNLRASTTAPMTPRRFVSKILHSVQRTRMRIPPDPEQAYKKFCGPGIPSEVVALRAALGSAGQLHG